MRNLRDVTNVRNHQLPAVQNVWFRLLLQDKQATLSGFHREGVLTTSLPNVQLSCSYPWKQNQHISTAAQQPYPAKANEAVPPGAIEVLPFTPPAPGAIASGKLVTLAPCQASWHFRTIEYMGARAPANPTSDQRPTRHNAQVQAPQKRIARPHFARPRAIHPQACK